MTKSRSDPHLMNERRTLSRPLAQPPAQTTRVQVHLAPELFFAAWWGTLAGYS
jgi:hypothetical protein